MAHNLIIACRYLSLAQAEQARIVLERAGIKAVITNAEIAQAAGLGKSEIHLSILEHDAEAAWDILSANPLLLGENANSCSVALDHNSCLSCGATMSQEDVECKKCGWTFAIER
jgi:hypothetical protein